ncbi:MAG: hypothetical protein IKX40_07815 [Thermoguttaceae bacterium]|nr:hypothetical protein [Thermoguttaceae bacterium]
MNMTARLIVSICLLALVFVYAPSYSRGWIFAETTLVPILFYLLNRKPVNDFLESYNRGRMADNDYHKAFISIFQFVYRIIVILVWVPAIILISPFITTIGNDYTYYLLFQNFCHFIAFLFVVHTVLVVLIGLIDRIPSFGVLFFVDLFISISWPLAYPSFFYKFFILY